MHPVWRRRLHSSVLDELQMLDGSQFELVCHHLVCLIEDRPFLLRGQTIDGQSLHGDLDSFDGTRRICVECGTGADYYKRDRRRDGSKGSFEKPLKDLRHAGEKCPDAHKVYLCSSQKLSNNDYQELLVETQEEATKLYGSSCQASIGVGPTRVGDDGGTMVLLFSGREVAEELVTRLLLRPDAVENFGDIPSLDAITHNFIFEKALPALPENLVGRHDISAKIRAKLVEHRIAVIAGISGIGKSWALMDFAHSDKNAWEEVIWLIGSEIADPPNFAALVVNRSGSQINLRGHLATRRVLLVVDNFSPSKESQARFIEAFKTDAISSCGLVLTTQSANFNSPYTLQIQQGLTREEVTRFLPCPEEIATSIYESTHGYPLVIQMIRGFVSDGVSTWQGVLDDIQPVHNMEVEGERLVRRLFSRHESTVKQELEVLRWLDVGFIDRSLLLDMLRPSGIEKLVSRSFLVRYDDDTYSIHDIVLACIRAEINLSESREQQLEHAFFAYARKHLMERPYHLVRNIVTFADRIRRAAVRASKPGIEARALLEMKDAKHEDLLVLLSEAPFQPDWDWYEITSVVEAMETRIDQLARGDERKALVTRFGARLREALSLFADADSRICSALCLHAGKLFWRADEPAAAKEHLERALVHEPGLIQAHLQLARVLIKTEPEVARMHLEEVLKASHLEAETNQSVTTLLAAYGELRKAEFGELRKQYLLDEPEPFLRTIRSALMTGSPQPLNVMAELVGALGFAEPELALHILTEANLPEPPCDSVAGNMALGRVFYGKYKALNAMQEFAAAQDAASTAVLYFERAGEVEKPFDKGAKAKGYHAVGQHDRALACLYSVAEHRRVSFDWLEIAKCEQSRGRLKEALAAIDHGIRTLTAQNRMYNATFFERRGKILEDMGEDRDALMEYQRALEEDGVDPKHALLIEHAREQVIRRCGSRALKGHDS